MKGYFRGLNHRNIKILLNAGVNKIITYGSAIWAFSIKARKIPTLHLIQRPFLINITQSFSTTSTNALQTIVEVTPLPIQTEIERLSTMILQLQKTTMYNDIIFNPQDYEEKQPKYNIHPAVGLHNFSCNIAKPPPSIELTAYMDGSKIQNKVGSGAIIKRKTGLHSEWQGYLRPQKVYIKQR
ncbi:hypothetical protein X975_22145, partial [Stegodyphus mimosarum]